MKTNELTKFIKSFGYKVVLPERTSNDATLFEIADFIITLGGDGTILSVAERAALFGKPILGINIGNLGYLTDCSYENAPNAIKKVLDNDCKHERRMLIKCSIKSQKFDTIEKCCLNDVCVTRGSASKIISFDLFINNNYVDNYNADGIIVSTPTGSTAYNLSAGGPILIPSAEMFAITPICPHMLTSRPIVVSSDDTVNIRICATKKDTIASLDGQRPITLGFGDVVEVVKAENSVDIIKTSEAGFYDILRQKLITVNKIDL